MSKKVNSVAQKTVRQYIVTQQQLKDAFGLEGDISRVDLWEGLSPEQEREGVSKNCQKFIIKTEEGKLEGVEDE